jgi:hypothetical protein
MHPIAPHQIVFCLNFEVQNKCGALFKISNHKAIPTYGYGKSPPIFIKQTPPTWLPPTTTAAHHHVRPGCTKRKQCPKAPTTFTDTFLSNTVDKHRHGALTMRRAFA